MTIRKSIKYGERTIEYSILYSERKTLTIIVHPDSSVLVRAPKKVSEKIIEERVQKKSKWIAKHLDYFMNFKPKVPPRQFVSGETHLYLGRRYRLKTIIDSKEKVVATRGCITVYAKDKDSERIKNIIEKWYREKADEYFIKSFNKCFEKFSKYNLKKPSLKIRKMKTRWGSYSSKGAVTLNLELIKKPEECIDYVVMHELCHIRHRNHGKGFYKLMDKVMPDWRDKKERLEKPE
jgi:predicted metal-dependent hydrolase